MTRKRSLTRYHKVALIIASQLLLFWLYVLYTPLDDNGLQGDAFLPSSNSLRRCVSSAHRDSRYVRPEVCVAVPQRVKALADLLYALTVLLENAQVVYWIDSGTLLGVYRAQQLIPWDYNADVGVTTAGADYLRSTDRKALEVPEGYELTVFNSSLHEAGETTTAVPVRFVDTTFGFYVNVFAFQESHGLFTDDVRPLTAPTVAEDVVGDGIAVETMVGPEPSVIWHRCVHCPVIQETDDSVLSKALSAAAVKQFRVPRDWVFPLRICKVELFEVMCPAQAVPYLMYIFGNRFLTPEIWD
ncbi:unnamed protein product [Hyaloperonospora brassicae]|uniref:LicD/FKTN/FKRP nucleotidyltransferase domain-containing protein n=1 Tax=Hyaloperonospora brassicae TaxID=162125 RepID=A0AAV0T1V5_HYABA|nr:unnamed protein product [Hyaloperonospora brassicae]